MRYPVGGLKRRGSLNMQKSAFKSQSKPKSACNTYTRFFPHCPNSSRFDFECTFGPITIRELPLAQLLSFYEPKSTRAQGSGLIPVSRATKQASLIFLILVQHLRMVAQPVRRVYQRRSAGGAVLRRHIYQALEPTTESVGKDRNCPREGADPGVKESSLA